MRATAELGSAPAATTSLLFHVRQVICLESFAGGPWYVVVPEQLSSRGRFQRAGERTGNVRASVTQMAVTPCVAPG